MVVLPKRHATRRGAIKSVMAAEIAAQEGNAIALGIVNIAVNYRFIMNKRAAYLRR